jgi:transcriptional regulator with XRE-family HTH domain
MDLKETLSTNLRRIRNETGRTQEEMADVLGISLRYLGSIERNKVSPSVTLLGQFAAALGISACDLITPAKVSRGKP